MDQGSSSSPEELQDRLLIAMSDRVGLARVQGRGSYKISPALKEFARQMREQGRKQFVVDLLECDGMDSTFMGTLAGICQRYTQAGGEPVAMTSVSPKLRQLMKTLGLDRLVQIQDTSWQQEESLTSLTGTASAPSASSLESAEHILEAHETLVKLSPENLSKFEDCIQYLRKDVQHRKS